MELFQQMASMGHERVLVCSNPEVGLQAIIAVHSTVLGPGLGGVRMWPYKSMDEALTDVLRLSRGMTYKAAAAGLNLGGGKAVIVGDPAVGFLGLGGDRGAAPHRQPTSEPGTAHRGRRASRARV